MGDVGKRSAVDEGRCIFRGLHEVGLNGVLEEHHDGAGHSEVLHRERFAGVGVAQQDVFDAAAQVGFVGGQAEDGHQLGSGRDVESCLTGQAVGRRAQTGHDGAQGAVVDIEHAAPQHFLESETVLGVLVQIIVEQCRNHVVC